MSDDDLRDALAGLLVGEPAHGPDVRRALAGGRSARRARRLTVTAVAGLVVVVTALAVPLLRIPFAHRGSEPVSPHPATRTATDIGPLCQHRTNLPLSFPHDPRLPICAVTTPVGVVRAAFATDAESPPFRSQFTVALPAGWQVAGPEAAPEPWQLPVTGGGSTLTDRSIVLHSADGDQWILVATAPRPAEPLYSDGAGQRPHGSRYLPSRGAEALAQWVVAQPWVHAASPVPGRVGGKPTWTVDVPAWHWSTIMTSQCDVYGASCALFGRNSRLTDPSTYIIEHTALGDDYGPASAPALYLGPGTSRLIFFDPPDRSDGYGVVAMLWDADATAAGRDAIRTTMQPIIDSIRFSTGAGPS
jgi:hypothetical protein